MLVDGRSDPLVPVDAPTSPPELGEILRLDEVAKYLKVSKKTVYKMVRSGKLPAFKFGKHWRVARAELEAWIARQSVENGEQAK